MIFAKLYQCLVLIILPICLLAATTPDVEDPLMNLYKKYKVVYTGSKGISLRRFLKNNDEYQNHIKRLKDVNGFKSHNVALRNGDQPDVNKTIYVNNPVESKLPQAFMSFEKFKQALIDRAQKDKDALKRSNLKAQLIKRWIVTTKRSKRRPTRTIKIEDVFKNVRNQNRESKDIGPILSDLQLMQKTLKKDHIKHRTRSHKGQSRASRKITLTNSKSIKKYKKDVILKHTIKTLGVQSRGTQNITDLYSTHTKKYNKALHKKHTSNILESGNIGPILIDSAKTGIKQNVSHKAQNREYRHITTNPTKHSTNVRMTQKQNFKNIDVKITKPSQAIAQTAINKSTIKDQIEMSPISDHKVLKTSVKETKAILASSAKAFYLRAEETTLRNVTETTENATSSINSSSITTESKNAKKLGSTVGMDVTTKMPPNFVGTKSTAASKLVIVTNSTVGILPVEAKISTNVTKNAPYTGEATRNVTDNAEHTEEATGNAKNTAEASVNVTENGMYSRKTATNMTESSANEKESGTNVTENATDATKSTPKLESMSSENEEEEEQDDTETPTSPTTTTVLTQRTLGRPRVFMGR